MSDMADGEILKAVISWTEHQRRPGGEKELHSFTKENMEDIIRVMKKGVEE